MTVENHFASVKDLKEAFSKVVHQIREEGFPTLRRTVSILKSFQYDSEASVKALASNIVTDPGMSARILRIANSPLFNPGICRIRTLTRAIVMLGVKNVLALAMSSSILEDITTREQAAAVLPRIVRALKRAFYAKQIASMAGDESPEEAFIAGLLYDLGNFVFDAFVPTEVQNRIRAIALRDNIPIDAARKRLLGFDALEVTVQLNRSWKLSPLLDDVLTPGRESNRTRYIVAAEKITEFLDKNGLDAPENAEFLRKVASTLGIPVRPLEEILRAGEKFSEIFGKEYAKQAVPTKEASYGEVGVVEDSEKIEGVEGEEPASTEGERLKRILGVVQDIVAMMYRGFTDPHLLFSLILEAIFSGLEMDFVFFALLTAERSAFRVRHSLVRRGVQVTLPEEIPLAERDKNLFCHLLFEDSPLWIRQGGDPELLAKASSPPASSFVTVPCMLTPIRPKSTTIGFIYADMRSRPEKMDEELFSTFAMFGQFATLGLSFLVSQDRTVK